MNWWIYKCNSEPNHNAYGDWQSVFDRNENPTGWGLLEYTPDLKKLAINDYVLAYQTDRNELVGVLKVCQPKKSVDGLQVQLEMVPVLMAGIKRSTIGAKVRPLKMADPELARIPALQGGWPRTIYEISDTDARNLLRAAGVGSIVGFDDFLE
jgi:hypothetical protein